MPDHATASTKRVRAQLGAERHPVPDPLLDVQIELPAQGQVIAERYLIERLLGRGGMGAVYEASHVISGKRVAVKWMLPALHRAELVDRFLHEARATARIDHPNVVDIYDVGLQAGSVYLVMELLHGESLAQRLERERPTPQAAIALLMPALRGVAAAHAQGVIHRDLKPDNIFLCTGPEGDARDCKVLDFGISKVAATDARDLGLTRSGVVMGTPYYMSPEQIRGLNQVDERGDVYAFGVILYEMLAGAYPYDADTYNALIVKIATMEPTPLASLRPDLDPELVAVVMRAMDRQRECRYASVAELGRALEPFAQGVAFRMGSGPHEVPSRTVRRTRLAAAIAPRLRTCPILAAVLIVIGVIAASWAASRSSPRERAREFQVRPISRAQSPTGESAEAPHAVIASETPASSPASMPSPAARSVQRPRRISKASARTRVDRIALSQPAPVQPLREPVSSLDADWDERVPTMSHLSPPNAAPTVRAATHHPAGQLTADDL